MDWSSTLLIILLSYVEVKKTSNTAYCRFGLNWPQTSLKITERYLASFEKEESQKNAAMLTTF